MLRRLFATELAALCGKSGIVVMSSPDKRGISKEVVAMNDCYEAPLAAFGRECLRSGFLGEYKPLTPSYILQSLADW